MEQNKEKISSKIKGIKFVMDNGEEKYQKGSFVFGCAISIEDKHCESFMIGECQEAQLRSLLIWLKAMQD